LQHPIALAPMGGMSGGALAAAVSNGGGLGLVGGGRGDRGWLERELEIVASHGFPPEVVATWRRFPVESEVPSAQAVRERSPVLIETLEERRRRFPGPPPEVLEGGSLAALPLLVGGRILGALGVVFREERRFGAEDLAYLATIARQCAQALDRARLHALEQRARRQAELANRAKDDFLATLSHELRGPLAPILQGAEMLRLRGDDPDFRRRMVERLERQALRVVRLLDDLLDVSRIAHGKIDLRETWIELGTLVRRAAESCEPLVEKRRHRLELDLPGEPCWLVGDPGRLEQVLVNLISNAAKYTLEGGEIRVSARAAGELAEVRIADDGQGIPRELLGRIFDLFQQGDSPPHQGSQDGQAGLGIGLALARELVELHGGDIAAHSDGPGRGSEFVVRLPRLSRAPLYAPAAAGKAAAGAPAAGAAAESPAENAAAGAAAVPDGARAPAAHGRDAAGRRSLRILVVEDEVEHAALLGELLELWGNEVELVHEGTAVVERAASWRPDVVLLDVGLPGMDGYQVAAALRARPATSAIHLIALTGRAEDGEAERSHAAGMDLHLTKPVEPAELRRCLELVGSEA